MMHWLLMLSLVLPATDAAEPVPEVKELATLKGHDGGVLWVAFSLSLGEVRLWDAATGKLMHRWDSEERVMAVALSPDGKLLASGGADGTVQLWDTATGKERHRLTRHAKSVLCMTFRPDGKVLATAGLDEMIRLWDPVTGKETASLKGDKERVLALAFSGNGRVLASKGKDDTIKLWDIGTGKEEAVLRVPHTMRAMALSADARTVIVTGYDPNRDDLVGVVRVIDIPSRKELTSFIAHQNIIPAVALTADGRC